jgi:hypothetical protein
MVLAVGNNIYDREELYTYRLIKQVNVRNNKFDVSLFNHADQGFNPGNFYPTVATLSSEAGDAFDAINVNATIVVN